MEISKEDIEMCTEIIRRKIKEVKHLKNIQTDDAYVQRFLYSTDFNIEAAYNRMLAYHETMVEIPEFYPKYSPLEKKHIIDTQISVVLPGCDKEGRPIFYQRLENINPDEVNQLDLTGIEDMWYEYLVAKHPEKAAKGICILIDANNGFSWKMLKWVTPYAIQNGTKKMNSAPIKDIHLHIVNSSTFFNIAISMIMPFIPEDRVKAFHCHYDDWDSLQEYIDKSSLPKEYGGDLEVNYTELYNNLYDKNEEIANNFQLYRGVEKC